MYKSAHCDMSKIKTTALMCDAALAAGVNATTSMLASLMFGLVCILRRESFRGTRNASNDSDTYLRCRKRRSKPYRGSSVFSAAVSRVQWGRVLIDTAF